MAWRRVGLTSIFIMVSTIATQMLQWIIMSGIGHREGPRMLGIYALAQAFALPLQFISFLSIRQRYLTSDSETEDNLLAMRAEIPALTFASALIAIFFVYGYTTICKMSACIFLLKYIEGFFDLAYSRMQKDNRAASLAKVSVVRSFISAMLFSILYWWTGKLYISMLIIAAQQVVTFAYIRRELLAFLPTNRRWFTFSIAAATALVPFAVSSVLTSLSSSIPRLILNGMIGAKELGYYTSVITLISIGQIAVGSLGQSLLTPLANALRDRDAHAFWSSILLPVGVTQLGCYSVAAVSLVLGGPVIRLIYGPDFAPAVPLLTIALITSGPFFASTLLTAALFATGRKYALLANQLVALGIMLTMTFILVPIYEAKGAFLALGISGVCQMIMCSMMLYAHLNSTLFSASDGTKATMAAMARNTET